MTTANKEVNNIDSKLVLRLTGPLGDTGDRILKFDGVNSVRYFKLVNVLTIFTEFSIFKVNFTSFYRVQ